MNRLISLFLGIVVNVSVYSGEVLDIAKAFYDSDQWTAAYPDYLGLYPETGPGMSNDQTEREALGQALDLIRAGGEANVQAAVGVLENLIRQQKLEQVKTHPLIPQITGGLYHQLSNLSDDQTQRKAYLLKAEEYLKKSLDPVTGYPNSLQARLNLADLLWRDGRMSEAKVHFLKAVELGDRKFQTFGLLGAIYYEEGKYLEAEAALRESVMINPTVQEFKTILGQVLYQQERYEEANAMFTELLQKKPGEVSYWMGRVNCYIAMDEIDKAAQILEILRFMGGSTSDTLMLLGDVYMNKDMIDEATELYIEAVFAKDASASKLQRLIGSAESLNRYAAFTQGMRVIDAINERFAADLSTEDEINLLSLQAQFNIALGKGEEAAENLQDLLDRDPNNARALLVLAGYYWMDIEVDSSLDPIQQDIQNERNQERALEYYKRAQELDDQAAVRSAHIGEAQLRVDREEFDLAIMHLETAQEISYQEGVQNYLNRVKQVRKNRNR